MKAVVLLSEPQPSVTTIVCDWLWAVRDYDCLGL